MGGGAKARMLSYIGMRSYLLTSLADSAFFPPAGQKRFFFDFFEGIEFLKNGFVSRVPLT
ncbi:MAG: hypothetical protein M0Z61_09435 [Nitrospiraceae bacterium]|nr:hypothetical protein [Nitrospiraceae bacterium]